MLKTIDLPVGLIASTIENRALPYGNMVVTKTLLEGIEELQLLTITPRTRIKKHDHIKDERTKLWEITIDLIHRHVYVCFPGEEHELVNNSDSTLKVLTLKGRPEYSYDEFLQIFFVFFGCPIHGSLVIND